MAIQLSISALNNEQTISPNTESDILGLYLGSRNVSTTRHIKLDMTRNCCASGVITQYYAPRYEFSLSNLSDTLYTPGGVSNNNRVAQFKLLGIDVSYIKKFEVQTNADTPTTSDFVYKEYTAAIGTTTGYPIYYLQGQAGSTYNIRITTIDDYEYTIAVAYNWADAEEEVTLTTVVTTYPAFPALGIVDIVTPNIDFVPTDWGLSTTDGKYLDGIYSYSLTQVETGADVVESVSKFFNIQLKCLVTTYLSNYTKDTIIGVMMAALETADDCNLSDSQKCSIHERIIRQLVLANQVKANSSLGCNCGCK